MDIKNNTHKCISSWVFPVLRKGLIELYVALEQSISVDEALQLKIASGK